MAPEREEYKYLIHNNNQFIHPLLDRKECKYLIQNAN